MSFATRRALFENDKGIHENASPITSALYAKLKKAHACRSHPNAIQHADHKHYMQIISAYAYADPDPDNFRVEHR